MKNIVYFYIVFLISIFIVSITFFNRKPINISKLHEKVIISPTYGTVTFSEKNKISVFLSPLDVHCQYAPIDSYIKDIKIVNRNTFNLANIPKSIHNEGVRVVFNSMYGDIVVIQRVGFFVRRIINNINIGDKVQRSNIYGFITFGSRVDIELPEKLTSVVNVNDKLIGGMTPLIHPDRL